MAARDDPVKAHELTGMATLKFSIKATHIAIAGATYLSIAL
jgi:hypothetical protein